MGRAGTPSCWTCRGAAPDRRGGHPGSPRAEVWTQSRNFWSFPPPACNRGPGEPRAGSCPACGAGAGPARRLLEERADWAREEEAAGWGSSEVRFAAAGGGLGSSFQRQEEEDPLFLFLRGSGPRRKPLMPSEPQASSC